MQSLNYAIKTRSIVYYAHMVHVHVVQGLYRDSAYHCNTLGKGDFRAPLFINPIISIAKHYTMNSCVS